MACAICDMIKEQKSNLLFGNERVCVLLSDEPASIGHIFVVPTQHYPIMEEVPDDLIAYMFQISNKVSTVLFETLQAMGTNVLVQNGVAAGQSRNHFTISVIPRRENDNIPLTWHPKQAKEDELSTALLKLEKFTKNIFFEEKKPKVEVKKAPVEKIEAKKDEETGEEKENYLLKQLDRMP